MQAAFQRLRSLIYGQVSYRILAAVFEGVTERIYGRTFALRTLPAYKVSLAERFQVSTRAAIHPPRRFT